MAAGTEMQIDLLCAFTWVRWTLCLGMYSMRGIVAVLEAEMACVEARLATLVLAYSGFWKAWGAGEGSGCH